MYPSLKIGLKHFHHHLLYNNYYYHYKYYYFNNNNNSHYLFVVLINWEQKDDRWLCIYIFYMAEIIATIIIENGMKYKQTNKKTASTEINCTKNYLLTFTQYAYAWDEKTKNEDRKKHTNWPASNKPRKQKQLQLLLL